ncbi:MAG TPA: MFS transporter [Candidatus Cybelea sp.]|nr:MFS transporter [Candidatus Cybelea sp.]
MTNEPHQALTDADRNWRRFILFRVLFNSRFYYPVLAVLFLDLGVSATEYTLLNFAWALAIVFTDLPAGVLADRIGRKPLVVAAAVFMVLEMILLAGAPLHGGAVLLLCCLANRILSGIAEGMASGADEALVFDSLAERDRAGEWPEVLAQVMRWQGVGLVIAMLVGGAVYDPAFVGRICSAVGWHHSFAQSTTLRFPIYLNLITALLTLAVVLGLREPKVRATHVAPETKDAAGPEVTAWRLVTNAGTWILKTPVALFVITAGVMIDSVVRLFLTFSSSYFRLIQIPEAAFGVIGATMGGLGLAVSPVARRMVANNSVARNYALLALTVLAGMIGVSCRWHYWGVLFIVPLAGAMMALDYIVSYYLNAVVGSNHRATVLSFKGVAFNLGYGFISLIFALVLKAVRTGGSAGDALERGLIFLPLWVVCGCVICGLVFWRQQKLLRVRI